MAYGTEIPQMCESVGVSTGESTGREAKFQDLMNQAYGINSVIEHLKELHSILGVTYEDIPRPEEVKDSRGPSLVRMLDELPSELSTAHSKIHDMIDVTIQQLN